MKELYYDYNRDTGNDPSILQHQIDELNERGFIPSYIKWLEDKLENKEFYYQLAKEQKNRFSLPNLKTNLQGFHL
jgi:fatty-acid desaturase